MVDSPSVTRAPGYLVLLSHNKKNILKKKKKPAPGASPTAGQWGLCLQQLVKQARRVRILPWCLVRDKHCTMVTRIWPSPYPMCPGSTVCHHQLVR